MKYLGNFGDVRPLHYGGFFAWEGAHTVYALITTNWCDATGECEHEEKVLIEEVHLDKADLIDSSWLDWEAVADTVGTPVDELLANPVDALQAAIGYYGAYEFHPGDYTAPLPPRGQFFESFKAAARFLKAHGVPGKDLGL